MVDYQKIDEICEGWSTDYQKRFFETVLSDPEVKTVLILGVLRGRDMAYCAALGAKVTGVDHFRDEPNPDWTEEMKATSNWQEATGRAGPSYEHTLKNLESLGLLEQCEVVCEEVEAFLKKSRKEGRMWDLVYVDTSHDYETTCNHIALSVPVAKKFIGGDDFPPVKPTWGVDRAVKESFVCFSQPSKWCWLARVEDYVEESKDALWKEEVESSAKEEAEALT